jgi:hypothetical protein
VLAVTLGLRNSGAVHAAGWIGHGPEGGVVRTLAVDPANPGTVYAGTAAGGVFKSTRGLGPPSTS